MNIFTDLFYRAKDFFFPGACALCGDFLTAPTEIRSSLCRNCVSDLEKVTQNQGSKCNLCGKPLISEIDTCLPCRNTEPLTSERSYERLWVLFPYIGKYRKLLTEYKFGKNLAIANFFAEKIVEEIKICVTTEVPELKDACFVPVPPRPGKIKENGWDQIEHLIKQMKKIPGCLPVKHCLKRKKSKVQKMLNREQRLENLKGRVYFTGKQKPANEQVFILIDDVITTGSTIEVCAAALKAGGAKKVYGLCLFYD